MDRRQRPARRASAIRNAVETLEPRRLLASISGTIIQDLNNNAARDGREIGMPNVTVFLDTNANRQLDAGETSTQTDANGFYEFTGLAPGQYFVAQVAPSGYDQSSPPRNGFGSFGGDFDIEIRFPGQSLSTQGRSLFESAAARWEKVIVGDVADVADSEDFGDVDDLIITATGPSIDGPGGVLAQAGPTDFRPDDSPNPRIPFAGIMEFDKADLNDVGIFETIIHEMGHVLGFTVANFLNYDPPLIGGTFGRPLFFGANTLREYNDLFGLKAQGVPFEDFRAGQGSAFSHFAEEVFGNELMTPFSEGDREGEPLSRLSVAVMEDLGYTVNYRGADPYDPTAPSVAPINPPTDGGGLQDYVWTVQIERDEQAVQGQDFVSRLNRRPSLDRLQADQRIYETGQKVRLRAIGPSDADPADEVSAVKFYVESNDIEGLQVGAGGDRLVDSDPSVRGGFRATIDTGALDLPAGSTTFYARPLDRLLTAGRTRSVTVDLFEPGTAPRRPTSIAAEPVGSDQAVVRWNDRSNNEFGFRVERSRNLDFTSDVRRFFVDAGVEQFNDSGLDAGTDYFYRVRAFNASGASGYTGPFRIITASRGERVIDSGVANDEVSFPATGIGTRADPGALFGGSVEISDDAFVRFNPRLDFAGEYFVYARWSSPLNDSARAVFDVVDSSGRRQRPVTVDQTAQGERNGYVLIGKYRFDAAQTGQITVRGADANQVVTIDAVRLLPAFTPPSRR